MTHIVRLARTGLSLLPLALLAAAPLACEEGKRGGGRLWEEQRPSHQGGCTGDCCNDACCSDVELSFCTQDVVSSDVPPKPLAGGTLLVSSTGRHAFVSDPDRDRIVIVDLEQRSVAAVINTPANAEPGRLVEGSDGRVYGVLRASGQLVVLKPTTRVARFVDVCASPRGVAIDTSADDERLLVACASGELLRLSTGDHPAVMETVLLEPDLRDVVVSGERIFVSHFRSAQVDMLDASGALLDRLVPPGYVAPGADPLTGTNPVFTPHVAWRMIARKGGGVWLVHQHARSDQIRAPETAASEYYGGTNCSRAAVHSTVTAFDEEGTLVNAPGAGTLVNESLPVDLAASPDGSTLALVAAADQIVAELASDATLARDGCADSFPDDETESRITAGLKEPVAATYEPGGQLLIQTREPATLVLVSRLSGHHKTIVDLGGPSRLDTGYILFHSRPDSVGRFENGVGLAGIVCASCHPEGRDDGHVWLLGDAGPRRSQSLAGDVRDTAPFHWRGELEDMSALMTDVYVSRMGGLPQSPERVAALEAYIGSFPAAPRAFISDAEAVERGRAVFESEQTGCADCHAGPKLTSAGLFDVGTGQPFQVPSLVGLGTRAPYMHDGCAATITERFGATCGGGDAHGNTSHLSSEELRDLVAFLASL